MGLRQGLDQRTGGLPIRLPDRKNQTIKYFSVHFKPPKIFPPVYGPRGPKGFGRKSGRPIRPAPGPGYPDKRFYSPGPDIWITPECSSASDDRVFSKVPDAGVSEPLTAFAGPENIAVGRVLPE